MPTEPSAATTREHDFSELLDRGRAWLAVYSPCGTPGCESPTCQLAYTMQRLIAADDAPEGIGP